ncbi:MFS transporter [Virgibacillus salexigens]|uniref:MFS transporter n=1 Tax=Virgibacillus kapii TaxID=1638645 RepID=A0ABQ2DW94_9BACI|nr:MFS transporter [Virgibacillus kapii]GGJ73494.1 MFS transporter [Virgibacillus kapii]
MTKEKLWTKDFVFVSIVNFVLMLSMYLLLVTMATYSMETYGASVSLGGLVASIFVIGSLIGRLFSGKKIQETGSKKILIIGSSLFLFLTFFYFFPIGIYPLIILRLLQGICLGMATTATGTIVAQVIPPTRNGEGIGYFSMSVVLATAIGPLIGVALVASSGYSSIFVFSLVMAVISFLLGLMVKVPMVQEPVETESKGFKLSNFFELNALPVSIAMFVAAFAYSGILSFITGYAADIDLVEAGSFYFLVYAVIILLTRPITGPLMDRKGGNSVAYPGLLLFAIGMLVLSQATTGWALLLAAAIIGLGYGNFQSTAQALAIKVTPKHRMGLANSTYFIGLDLGLGVGPFVLGYLVPISGYRGMYVTLTGLVIVGLMVYYFAHGRKDKGLLQAHTAVARE